MVQETPDSDEPPKRVSGSTLLKHLMEAATFADFMKALLTAQAITVAGTEAAGFVVQRGANDAMSLWAVAHVRPDEASDKARTAAMSAFEELVRPCVEQGKDGAIQVSGPNQAEESQFCLVTLLRADGKYRCRCRCHCPKVAWTSNAHGVRRLLSMELMAGYFELLELRRSVEQYRTIS